MSQEELIAVRFALSDATTVLTPEQRAATQRALEERDAAAVRNLHSMAERFAYTAEARDEILQALGLLGYEVDRVFVCGHPQTPENSTPESRPGVMRCKQCKNTPRAERTYPRNRQGQA